MKSILQEDTDYCYICGRYGTEIHHVFGASNRKWSTKYGLLVGLCYNHHRGNQGVHFNKELNVKLKQIGQKAFMEHYPEADFLAVFGRNYL
jgi:hypothetical protein